MGAHLAGYGVQCGLFAKPLAEHYDLRISSFYGLEGARLNWEGIQVLPGLGGEFGNSYLLQNAEDFFGGLRDGLVVTLIDVWVLDPRVAQQVNMACWVPVDHDPAPPAVLRFFYESGAIPIAMSRFGQAKLAELKPLYVPHAVDTEAYQPHDKREARESVGIDPDEFLIGIVAANKGAPSRKCFSQALQAFREFRLRHENAKLYLHTTVQPDYAQGEDIPAMLAALDIPEGSVYIADQYRIMHNPMGPSLMGKVMSTFDVLLNPSAGEGFGVTVLEAQACGVPAIVTDFSAMKEVCGAGWKVKCYPQWTGQKSWQATPDIPSIVDALEDCYSLPSKRREELSRRARSHATKYALPTVMERHMLPVLEQVQERIEARDAPPKVELAA